MTHRISQKKLSRDTDHRASLIKNLATSLILHERVITTQAKAKTARPFVEKLVTVAKEDSVNTRRHLAAKVSAEAKDKLIEIIGPLFKQRPGGYTRILKLGPRVGDRAEMAVLEFVEKIPKTAKKKTEEKILPKKAPEKKAGKKALAAKKETPKKKSSQPRTKKGAASGKSKAKG